MDRRKLLLGSVAMAGAAVMPQMALPAAIPAPVMSFTQEQVAAFVEALMERQAALMWHLLDEYQKSLDYDEPDYDRMEEIIERQLIDRSPNPYWKNRFRDV